MLGEVEPKLSVINSNVFNRITSSPELIGTRITLLEAYSAVYTSFNFIRLPHHSQAQLNDTRRRTVRELCEIRGIHPEFTPSEIGVIQEVKEINHEPDP